MLEIKTMPLGKMRNNEYAQFMSEVNKLVLEETVEKLHIENKYEPFKTAIDQLLGVGKPTKGSNKTVLVSEADATRDKTDGGLLRYVESFLFHWDNNTVAAATRLMDVINKYGNLRKLSYNEETNGITNKVEELKSETFAPDVALINATLWVNKLEEHNQNFISIFNERANQESARSIGSMRESRMACDTAYDELVKLVNALIMVNGDDNYKTFADKMNYYIDYYINAINMRLAHYETDDTNQD